MPIDYKNYPADWQHRRARILSRAGHRCEHCGVLNYSVIQRGEKDDYEVIEACTSFQEARAAKHEYLHRATNPIIIVLTLAHLDHDEWNDEVEDSRLAALCQRCHLQYDKHDNLMRKQYGRQYARYQKRIEI